MGGKQGWVSFVYVFACYFAAGQRYEIAFSFLQHLILINPPQIDCWGGFMVIQVFIYLIVWCLMPYSRIFVLYSNVQYYGGRIAGRPSWV